MNLHDFPAGLTDWAQTSATQHPGASGYATIQARRLGDAQLRRIVYSPGYLADHWCHKGHILMVLAGELTLEQERGRAVTIGTNQAYCIADNDGSPHRVRSENGATILVVD